MYKLAQYMKNIDQNYQNLLKLEPFSININLELLDRDINRLKDQLDKAKNKNNIANIKYIINYLEMFKLKIEDNSIEICYNVRDNIIATYPVEIKSFEEYRINMSDYLELHNEKLVVMNINDIIDIMAFEYIYKDFGYSHEDMENTLEKSGITGAVSTETMRKMFELEDIEPYKIGKAAKLEESTYLTYTKKLKDYFGTFEETPRDGKYNAMLVRNARTICSLIAAEIAKNYDYKLKIILIGETSFAFIVDESVDIDNLKCDATIRFFGRQFKIEPKISIF